MNPQVQQVTAVIDSIGSWIVWAASWIVTVGLALLIAQAVLSKFGWARLPLPLVSESVLAYLAGAWWLYRGGKLF